MKRLRIVLSNASYSWGGVHYVTEALARGLQRRGHDVVVFGRPDSPLQHRMKDVAPFEPILRGMDLSPIGISKAARALKRHKTDVALTLMKKDVRITGPAARMMGIPFIVRHANDRPLRNQIDHRVLFGSLPTLHVANSESTRDTLLKSAPWLEPSRIEVIYNGIDVSRFERAEAASLDLPKDAVVVAFLGRLEVRKGVMDLARAWPMVAHAMPNAHLVIVGKGNDEAQFRAALRDSPRVHWLGYRTDGDSILRASDVVAMPSHWEGFGLVALEGLAAGVPVVASNVSSLPEIVRHGVDGLLVEPRDYEAIARAVLRLLGDEDERRAMGDNGRVRAEEVFGIDTMVDHYEELFLRVTFAAAARPPGI